MRRRAGLLLVSAVCAALSSCVPTAKEPLSDATRAEPDKGLIGAWVMEKDERTRFMMVGRLPDAAGEANPAVPRGLMAYEQISLGKDGSLSRDGEGVFFVARIKGETYANVFDATVVQEARKQGSWAYPADTAFMLVRYRLERNTLTVAYLDKDRVKAAIDTGAIKGTIRGMGGDDEVVLAGGAGLAEYLAKAGGKSLWPDEASERWQRAKVVPVK
jgi:hypothetical protein